MRKIDVDTHVTDPKPSRSEEVLDKTFITEFRKLREALQQLGRDIVRVLPFIGTRGD